MTRKTLRQKIDEDPYLVEVDGIIDYRYDSGIVSGTIPLPPDDKMFSILLYCIDVLQGEGYNLQMFERRGLSRILYKHVIPNTYKSRVSYRYMAARILLLAIRGLR